jgi:hypothetical protein
MGVTLAISWRWGGRIGQLAAWHVVVTLGIALVLSVVWKPIAILRYFVPAQALLLCGLASAWPAQSWIGRAITLNLVATSLVLVAGLWPRLDPPPNVEGIRGAVAWVESQRDSNDVVLVQRPFLYLPWRYYDRTASTYLTGAAVSRLTHYEACAPRTTRRRCTSPRGFVPRLRLRVKQIQTPFSVERY